MTRLEQVGKRVRDQLEVGPDTDRDRLAQQQQRLIDAVGAGRGASWRKPALALAGAVILLVLSAVIFLRLISSPPIECRAADGKVIAEGDWVGAPDHTVSLSFTEGSTTEVTRQSRVRLSRNDAKETRLTLESGRLRARINRHGRDWTFLAGPYRVRVTGTQLAISWDDRRQQFEVEVAEGKVRVLGEGIDAQGIAVRGGERLRADRARGEIQHTRPLDRPSEPKPMQRADAGPGVARDIGVVADAAKQATRHRTARSSKRPRKRPRRAATASQGWQRKARDGDFAGALTLVKKIGFRRVLQRATAWDLLLLADACRLGGRLPWAKRCLVTLRRRHSRTEQARLAAFRLGKLAFDHQRDYVEAIRWLQQFLREAPRHTLASHARGRLMLALKRSGKTEAARQAATTYLRYHPGGSYAAAARAILEKGKRQTR